MKNTITGLVLALVSVAVFSSNAKAWAPTCITSATYQAGTYSPGDPVLFDASGSSPIGTAGGRTPYWRWDFNYNGTIHWDTTTYTPQCYHSFSKVGTYTVAVAYFDSYGSAGQPYPFTMSISITAWDWTQNNIYNIYYTTGSGTVHTTDRLPWFDGVSPPYHTLGEGLFPKSNLDFYPSEGWRLIYKNFGTSGLASGWPMFILYNRYTGIMRVFFWNNLLNNYFNYGMVTLSITGQQATPLLTYNDGPPQFSEDYKNVAHDYSTLTAITKILPYEWGVTDFKLVGYDSTVGSKYCNLNFEVYGIDTSNIRLSGSQLFNGVIGLAGNSLNLQSSGSSNSMASAISSVSKEDKGISYLWNDLSSSQDSIKSPWFKTATKNLLNNTASSLLGLIPGVGTIAGLVTDFIGTVTGSGTGNQPSAPTPITLHGTISLTGNTQSMYEVANRNIPVPGSAAAGNQDGSGCYNEPLGIFNVTTEPTFGYCDMESAEQNYVDPGEPPNYELYDHLYVGLESPISIQYNPASGLSLVSSQVALVDTGSGIDVYTGAQTPYYNTSDIVNYVFQPRDANDVDMGGGGEGDVPPSYPQLVNGYTPVHSWEQLLIALKLKFRYLNSLTNTEDTVYFVKTYPAKWVYDPKVYSRTSGTNLGFVAKKASKPALQISENTPKVFALLNYPNPFNPTATVDYSLPKESRVSVRVYDILGQQVATLADGVKSAGYYKATFDGSRLASGIYFIRLVAQPLAGGLAVIRTEKAMLLK